VEHHRIHTVAYGRVQGVGFREFTRRTATRLALSGYVCNLPNGAVLVEAEGPESAVAELLQALRQGPPYARVDTLDPLTPTADALPSPFEIR